MRMREDHVTANVVGGPRSYANREFPEALGLGRMAGGASHRESHETGGLEPPAFVEHDAAVGVQALAARARSRGPALAGVLTAASFLVAARGALRLLDHAVDVPSVGRICGRSSSRHDAARHWRTCTTCSMPLSRPSAGSLAASLRRLRRRGGAGRSASCRPWTRWTRLFEAARRRGTASWTTRASYRSRRFRRLDRARGRRRAPGTDVEGLPRR